MWNHRQRHAPIQSAFKQGRTFIHKSITENWEIVENVLPVRVCNFNDFSLENKLKI